MHARAKDCTALRRPTTLPPVVSSGWMLRNFARGGAKSGVLGVRNPRVGSMNKAPVGDMKRMHITVAQQILTFYFVKKSGFNRRWYELTAVDCPQSYRMMHMC